MVTKCFQNYNFFHSILVVNGGEPGVDEVSQEEVFEEKLKEAMDLAGQKSAQGRTMALESMCTAFLRKFIPDFVEDRRMTITDIVERAMKKGSTPNLEKYLLM